MADETPWSAFTAPVAGRYHFISGRTPHLDSECDAACKQNTIALGLLAGQEIHFMQSPADPKGAQWLFDGVNLGQIVEVAWPHE